ncbi:MAG: Autoinducer 2 sensor kinase/phosphatase LuxQ [Bacteroidota bacterium]|jgi:PAS domain S-box-containing protein
MEKQLLDFLIEARHKEPHKAYSLPNAMTCYFEEKAKQDPAALAQEIAGLLSLTSSRIEDYKANIQQQNKILEQNAAELTKANQQLEQDLNLQRKTLRNLRNTAVMLARYSNVELSIEENNIEILSQLVQELIANREQDRLALVESKIKYSNLVEEINSIVMQINADGEFTFLNKAWYDITGHPIEHALHHSIYQFINDEQASLQLKEAINHMVQHNVLTYQTNLSISTHAKKTVYVELALKLSFNITGEINGITGIMTDITEILEKNKKINTLKDFYENILNKLPIDIAIFDQNHKYLYLNASAIKDEELRKWLIGKDDFDYAAFRGKSMDIATERREAFEQVIATGEAIEWEEHLPQGEGKGQNYIRWFKPISDENQQGSYVIGYGFDITERKSIESALKVSEAQFKAINTIVPVGIFIENQNRECIFVNEAFTNITGLTSEQTLVSSWRESMHAEDKKEATKLLEEAYKKNKTSIKLNTRYVHHNGSTHWTNINITEIRENEKLIGYIGVVLDITENVMQEQELLRAKEIALDSLRTKEQFLANMSHEIRTPMNAVIGMSDLLLKTTLSEKQLQYMEAINHSGKNLLVIINDILDFSKIEAGKLELEHTGFQLHKLVSNTIDQFQYSAAEKSIQLNFEFRNFTGSEIFLGDPTRITQVLNNLISNGIKFTEQGGVNVSIVKTAEDHELTSLEFKITDTGIGIAPDKIEQVFESFTQAHTGVARKYGGTGLGLAITKNLVEMMGGKVRLQSKINLGSTFTFTLKLFRGTIHDLQDELINNSIEIINYKLNILLAEDHKYNQMYAQSLLGEWGIKVDIAENGKVAINKLQEQHYDLVLMDLQMPVCGGLEATHYIRTKLTGPARQIPIIALTANAMKADIEKCYEAGMNDYITKPFDPQVLLKKIKKYTKASESDETLQQLKNADLRSAMLAEGEKLVDLGFLKKMSRGNKTFVLNMINMFYETSNPLIYQIKKLQEEKEYTKVKKAIHKLKPSIDSMGMKTLKSLLIAIEDKIESNQLMGIADELNAAMHLYTQCEDALKLEQHALLQE